MRPLTCTYSRRLLTAAALWLLLGALPAVAQDGSGAEPEAEVSITDIGIARYPDMTVVVEIVNVEAFGWRLPMYLFPADYLRLGVFALGAAIVAALWPARQLARIPPSQLLKVFANER